MRRHRRIMQNTLMLKNIVLQSYRAEQVRLENKMNLAYQVYTSVVQQLQMAEAKVQEIAPIYTVVEPVLLLSVHRNRVG